MHRARLRSTWDILCFLLPSTWRLAQWRSRWELQRLTPAFPAGAERPGVDDDTSLVEHGSELLAIDPVVDAALGTLETRVEWSPERYRLPDELRAMAPSTLRRSTTAQLQFNGPTVRLETDLTRRLIEANGDVVMRRAAFFDEQCSNELTPWRLSNRGRHFDFRGRYLLDPHGRLGPLSGSALANGVGVSTLAFTTDQHLVVVLQAERSRASANRWAPSGSGGLEPRDLPEASTGVRLRDFVARGMERELREETGLAAAVVGPTWLTGYGRWLDRGGRPEFFGVTRLGVSSADVRGDRRPRSERSWVETVEAIPYEGAAASLATSGSISLPLAACLDALRRATELRPTFLDAVLDGRHPWEEPVHEIARGGA